MAGAAVVIAALIGGGYFWGGSSGASRQEAVAQRGADVMPFDLERTTHRFSKRPFGGIQTVVADDVTDDEQVRLVREHLRKEAAAFRAGRFDDPARIHGMEMPGLAELRESSGRLDIGYADVRGGARLTFRSADQTLVAALHAWFDAQLVDHGAHSEPGA